MSPEALPPISNFGIIEDSEIIFPSPAQILLENGPIVNDKDIIFYPDSDDGLTIQGILLRLECIPVFKKIFEEVSPEVERLVTNPEFITFTKNLIKQYPNQLSINNYKIRNGGGLEELSEDYKILFAQVLEDFFRKNPHLRISNHNNNGLTDMAFLQHRAGVLERYLDSRESIKTNTREGFRFDDEGVMAEDFVKTKNQINNKALQLYTDYLDREQALKNSSPNRFREILNKKNLPLQNVLTVPVIPKNQR